MRTRRSGIKATATIGVFVLFITAAPVFAVDIIDDPMQIDDRAADIVTTSNSLCWEMHRYHQQQPEFAQTYRSAKEIWSRAGEMREALRAGPVETDVLKRQVTEMNDIFSRVEATMSKWGPGDRSQLATNSGPAQRTVVTPGTEVDLPFIGLRVGRPQVIVTDDGPPQLERRRLHPNSPGSKRSLERELAAVRVALNDMLEDAGVTGLPASPDSDAAAAVGPAPKPPVTDAAPANPKKTPSKEAKE
ncbi:MAG: hypothetical protein JWM11_6052 [Planctomycetaceae bacterium]|nr:hypothetical protein [Planctomycetaceae bacterium]